MQSLIKTTSGFTLVEMLTTIAILAIVSLFLAQTYIDYGRLYNLENAKVDINLANQTVLNDLTNNVKEAASVLATSTIGSENFTSSGQSLILTLPAINAQEQIISGAYDQVIYYLDPANQRKLIKRVAPDPSSARVSQNKTLNSDVNYLDFAYNTAAPADAKAIVTTLVTSRLIYGNVQAVTSTIRAVLRNK